MSPVRKPKFDEVIEDVRVRVYSTRSDLEVIFGDGDIDDPEADVWCYPRTLGVHSAAHLARAERR